MQLSLHRSLFFLGVIIITIVQVVQADKNSTTIIQDEEEGDKNSSNVDECAHFGACSQTCTSLGGTSQCSCISGFRLKENRSCELIDNNPILIFAQLSAIRVHQLKPGNEQDYFADRSGSPVSVTYDARSNFIYWSDVMDKEEAIWRSTLDGKMKEKVVTTGLVLPEGVAFDWIANNIYFTDSNKSHIVVCTANGGNCSVVIEELNKPRDLALHPNMGQLYWTDWGQTPCIMKAGMDGSVPIAIILDNLKWPNGITVDHGNNRIYWTDAGTDKIETANLDGGDRLIVHSAGINHPFGIDVLGDDVYWSDWNLYEIQKSNKFDGSNHQSLVKEKFEQLNGLAVFHKANQPITRKNHCKDSDCSHICTLTPTSYKCKCPVGMYLDRRNKRTCSVDKSWPAFVIGYNNTIKISPINAIGGNTFAEYEIPELSTIVAIATIPFNTTVFISDLDTKKIYSYDTKTLKLAPIVDSVGFAKGMGYDEVGNNLYWVDSIRKTVEVMSLKTMTRVILFKETDRPIDIVVAPNIRMLFLAETSDRGAKIVRMNMNGFNRRVLYRQSRAEPISLTYNIDMQRLYWTDVVSETIESVGIDGTEGYTAVSRAGYPFGMTSFRNSIYWTDRHTQLLMEKDLSSFSDHRGIFLGDYAAMRRGEVIYYGSGSMMAKVALLNGEAGYNTKLLNDHECTGNKNQCSHICLLSATEFEGTCICPDNLKLHSDGHTCIGLSDKDAPSPAICVEGRCRTQLTTKKPSSKKSKSGSKSGSSRDKGKDSKDKNTTDISGRSDSETTTLASTNSSSSTEFLEFLFPDGLSWWDDADDDVGEKDGKKKKKSKPKKPSLSELEKDKRREKILEYDEYDGSLSSEARVLPNGKVVQSGDAVIQQESDVEKDVIVEGTHPLAIALGVVILLVLVAVIVAIVLHRRNVHPKVLVRPYVQHWVKYVNQPVQRFFENRGDQMDSGKRHIYDEVYHRPTSAEHSYSNFDDSSVNVYEEPGDSHRITYSQSDKLIP